MNIINRWLDLLIIPIFFTIGSIQSLIPFVGVVNAILTGAFILIITVVITVIGDLTIIKHFQIGLEQSGYDEQEIANETKKYYLLCFLVCYYFVSS